MHKQQGSTFSRWVVLAALTLLAPLAARADGQLAACIGKASDVMRLVDPNGSCRSGENKVTWNVQGPQGPAGPQTMLNAVVNHDGSFAAVALPPGATLNVSRVAPGSFQVDVTGLGNTCPLPMAMSYAGSAAMAMGGGSCQPGALSINLYTTNGAESGFVLYVTALQQPQQMKGLRNNAPVQFVPR